MVCGGDYYDRDVYTAPTPSRTTTSRSSSTSSSSSSSSRGGSGGFSSTSAKVFRNATTLSGETNPSRFSSAKLTTPHSNPIVCAIDVTGSMGDWTKIIYDKLPMFYGQIMMQRYLTDPSLSFAAVGDCFADDAPLQVTDFGQGRQIDQMVSKFWLEGGGGGGHKESYELAAYFYTHRCDLPRRNCVPFFFMTGDELFFPTLKGRHIREFLNINPGDQDSSRIFQQLRDKFKGNVFLLKKPYWNEDTDRKIREAWANVLGGTSHILDLKEAKACVDVMLGAIALVSKTRTLEQYVEDMKGRQQSESRIREVRESLFELSCELTGVNYKGGSGRHMFVDFDGLEDDGNDDEEEGEDDDDDDEDDEILIRMSKSEYKNLVSTISPPEEISQLKQKLERLKQEKEDRFPKELLCPITMEVMVDPVVTDDGHSYDRLAIEQWLMDNDTSPMTNKKLKSKDLRPNHALRKLISDLTK